MHHLCVSDKKILLHPKVESLPAEVVSLFPQHYSAMLLRGFLKLPPNLQPSVTVLVVMCLSWAQGSNRCNKRHSGPSPN